LFGVAKYFLFGVAKYKNIPTHSNIILILG